MTQAKTEHSEVSFRVCEGENTAFIGTREGIDITIFHNGADLYFTLNDDSYENAQRVVQFLNENIKLVAVTVLGSHPMFKQFRE